MKKTLLSKSLALGLILAGTVALASPVLAADPISNYILKGVSCASGEGENITVDVPGQITAGQQSGFKKAPQCDLCDFVKIFVNAADLIVAVSGALAILIFVYAGVMYLTVSFKPDNVEKAKNAVKAAVIGLAFIFGAYSIINFVIITFVGGEEGMNVFYGITGQRSWGVCAIPNTGSNSRGTLTPEEIENLNSLPNM